MCIPGPGCALISQWLLPLSEESNVYNNLLQERGRFPLVRPDHTILLNQVLQERRLMNENRKQYKSELA